VKGSQTVCNVTVCFSPFCSVGCTVLLAFGVFRLINLVGEDVLGVSSGSGQSNTDRQLGRRFTISTDQHGQGVVPVERLNRSFSLEMVGVVAVFRRLAEPILECMWA
jgi:hypothetical protein